MNQKVDDKVTLDRSTFKALASESRIAILKSLDERRKTASELSKGLGATVQAVAEHLNSLRSAGLVDRRESGRKWVYYELTEKGRAVLHPDTKKFWVLVALSLIAFTAAFYRPVSENFLPAPSPLQTLGGNEGQLQPAVAPQDGAAGGEAQRTEASGAFKSSQPAPVIEAVPDQRKPVLHEGELMFLLAGAALLAAAGWLRYSKKTA